MMPPSSWIPSGSVRRVVSPDGVVRARSLMHGAGISWPKPEIAQFVALLRPVDLELGHRSDVSRTPRSVLRSAVDHESTVSTRRKRASFRIMRA